jgi:hypothetical protein
LGGLFDEQVGDREQNRASDKEQPAEQGCEPQLGTTAGQAQPG